MIRTAKRVFLQNPLKIIVVADAHIGYSDKGEAYGEFIDAVNENEPDVFIDLGDIIEGKSTDFYEGSDEDAALLQRQDWYEHFQRLNPSIKSAIAFGNRDVASGYPLDESSWVDFLGWSNNNVVGGSQLQNSFVVEKGSYKCKIFILSTYSGGYNEKETVDWIKNEINDFDGDMVLTCAHGNHPYPAIRDMVQNEDFEIPIMHIHGHNHLSDTVTRNFGGMENTFDYPMYGYVDFMKENIGAELQLHRALTYQHSKVYKSGSVAIGVIN